MSDPTPARLPCGGRPGDALHHDDGTHRTTPATTQGRVLDRFEQARRKHQAQMAEDRPANYFAPDGFRYGVMYRDGSVSDTYNGRNQRQRAEAQAMTDAADSYPDNITLARRRPNGAWERVTEDRTADRMRAALRLLDDGDITPQARSILLRVLGHS